MPNRTPSKRRIMKEFVISELSAVDSPAQKHALAVLMKRDDDDVAKDYYEQPQLVAEEINALTFDEVLAEQEAREAAMQVKDNVWARWNALCRSFETIAADDDVSPADKVSSMQESLRQFIASLEEQSDVIAETISKSLRSVPALSVLFPAADLAKGEVPMTAAEKQQLIELQKKVADLTKMAAGDDVAKDAKKAAEIQETIKAIGTEVAALAKKLEEDDAERAELVAKAGMSDDEKDYLSSLDKEGKAKFMAMTPDERKKAMKVKKDEDPVVYKSQSTGEEYRKSDDPRLIAMAKKADEAERIAKDERERREAAEFAKKAAEDLKHFAGDDTAKVSVVRAMAKMDDTARTALEGMLNAGGKAIGAAFETIGHRNEDVQKSANAFEKRVDEIMKRDSVTKLVALEKAEREYPAEFQAYQETGAVLSPTRRN